MKLPKIPVTGEPIISARNLSISYGDRRVINSVTLSVQSGEVVAILGENGAGKTSLMTALGGLLVPESGSVYLKESLLKDLNTKDIARVVAMVFQNPNHQIFERTVWKEQNLTLESLNLVGPDTLARSETLLERAKIVEMKERNPFSLSHGQKRRLNMTSSVVHKPELLLLDEPFIGQDEEGRSFIIETVHNVVSIGSGAAAIITHDPDFVRNHCNRAIFMKDGEIVLDGTPQSVFERLESMGHREYSDLGVNP